MSEWTLLELTPAPDDVQSHREETADDITTLKQHVAEAEIAVIELSRQITEAIVSKRPAGALSAELSEIMEARDFMQARLTRLQGGHHG
jgi:hypothetical protein